MARQDTTVKERILIHILSLGIDDTLGQYPIGATQNGMLAVNLLGKRARSGQNQPD